MPKTGQLYIFGDSLSDDGASAVQLQDEPIDLFFAGRASNGLVWHENIRNDLAVAPAATSISQAPNAQGFLSGSDLNGINFAHSGAVSDSDSKPTLPGAVQQAEGFAALVASGDIPAPDDQDVFVIWIGGNDFLQFADANLVELFQILNLGPSITQNIETTVETLQAVGASNFLILGQPTVGGAFLGNRAAESPLIASLWNNIAEGFNTRLDAYVDDLNTTPGQNALFIDIAALVEEIEDTPEAFGFDNVTSDIFADDAALDDQSYFSVDGIHPTGAGHAVIAAHVVAVADTAGFDLTALAGNVVPGSDRDDMLSGTQGDDSFTGAAGDDILDGQGGSDLAVLSGPQNLYTLSIDTEITLTDRSGADGTDTLIDIETLDFDGQGFALGKFDGGTALSTEDLRSLAEVYLSYFDRAPDALGLAFWANAFADGRTLPQIAEAFAASDEAQVVFPLDGPDATFVTAVYQNALGRAPDDAGFAFWSTALANGAVSRGQFVLKVLEGARSEAPDGADAGFVAQKAADQAFLDARIDIGLYYSATLGLSDPDHATEILNLFDGSDNSLTAALSAADARYDAALASDGTGAFLVQLVGLAEDPFIV
ncbi:SGNH/GDSL hydrolase family protein [Marivita sp. S6314]|uniref:SGNH/GDSL hydrolase family protein n=1 Tax=Marivita sp. S6314 TaxID=2926406 RepID=UPI001FF3B0D5|nr:SGNH/GDSL hydrolase family protein [Marivita sp. S6314]MCK0148475.1 SGNH/GDSL hydrolase family protein [Marivita sp. S6314]